MPWQRPATLPRCRPRRPARDLIELVLEHMRKNLEPLKYSTLAPSRYLVYLHAAEYARLEGILGILQAQTIRAPERGADLAERRHRADALCAARVASVRSPPSRTRRPNGRWSSSSIQTAICSRATCWSIRSCCCRLDPSSASAPARGALPPSTPALLGATTSRRRGPTPAPPAPVPISAPPADAPFTAASPSPESLPVSASASGTRTRARAPGPGAFAGADRGACRGARAGAHLRTTTMPGRTTTP